MEDQDAPLDTMSNLPPNAIQRISNLPPNVIQRILTLMPMQDAFRASILSRDWRDHCSTIPKLRFDDAAFQGSSYENSSLKLQLFHVVYPILLLHQGPILSFKLSISRLRRCCEIDQIILYLSRNDTLRKFKLLIVLGEEHKLLPAFFKFQQLTVLKLLNCAFQPPITFKGFRRLVRLSFVHVSITGEVFLRFISNCPLLKHFTLMGEEVHFMGCWNCNFVELLECLPLLEYLRMSSYPVKCFAKGVIPQKLRTPLVHLKRLSLAFEREIDLQTAFLLVTSSPNIETIELEMEEEGPIETTIVHLKRVYLAVERDTHLQTAFLLATGSSNIETIELEMKKEDPTEDMTQTAMDLIAQQDYSYVTFDHLREIQIVDFPKLNMVVHFLKFVLAKLPMLKKVYIWVGKRMNIHDRVKIVEELLRGPRASARVKIRFKGFMSSSS